MAKTFASLFTGGGLADIGAMMAGYDLLWGVELAPEIAAVASANLPHKDRVYVASVIGFDWARLERVDHLHMSPPCQDFSSAKHHKSKDDLIRALNLAMDLANACIDAINYLHPNTVTLENVEKYRKPIVINNVVYDPFNRIVDVLWGLGYWVNSDVLNAADFGVPQTRRRLILRAVRGAFPGPLPPPVRPWKGWHEAIEDLIPTLPETQFAAWQMERLPKGLETALVASNRDATVRCAIEPSTTVVCVGDGHSVAPKAYLVDGIANNKGPTVTTVDGTMTSYTVKAFSGKQASRAATPSGRVVRLTARSLARFQTVPDWYVLPGKKALACKIIGNGVPCLMMQRILESICP